MKERNFVTAFLLSIVTCGIYGIFWWYSFTEDLNRLCEGRSDSKPSPNYIVVMLLSFITCGIYFYCWIYKQGDRMAEVAPSYDVNIQMNGNTMLLWFLLGSLIAVGPAIGWFILIDNFNKMAAAYNQRNVGTVY